MIGRSLSLLVVCLTVGVIMMSGCGKGAAKPEKTEKGAVPTEKPQAKESKETAMETVLSERFLDRDPDVRRGVIRYIRDIKEIRKTATISSGTLTILVKALGDRDLGVATEAKEIIVRIGLSDEEADVLNMVETLIEEGLVSNHETLSGQASQCLVEIGELSVGCLIKALNTDKKQTRRKTQDCLKKIGDPALDALRKAREKGSPQVSLSAAEVIFQLEDDPNQKTKK